MACVFVLAGEGLSVCSVVGSVGCERKGVKELISWLIGRGKKEKEKENSKKKKRVQR